jgi:predicted small secreted protein
MLQRISMALAALCVLATLAGCNTIAGAGRDIERGGEIIRDTARDVQRKL